MKIAAVVVTCNRLLLLPRALISIVNQKRKPDLVIVVSNSSNENFCLEEIICHEFGSKLIKNERTNTYTGALNTAVEETIKYFGIKDDVYFASLDDDDEWLPDYLYEIEANNTEQFDLLIGCLLRSSISENCLQVLPKKLVTRDFLIGNPGVCGSNTFIRLKTLLRAGSFDESVFATTDRDFMVRVFQLQPTYKIIKRHLVTQYTDNNRMRLTTRWERKKDSLLTFYYKYQHLMSIDVKELFFERSARLFSVDKVEFENLNPNTDNSIQQEIDFKNKGNYQFIIGFIAGNEIIAERLANQIVNKNIQVDLVLIIDNTQKPKSLIGCEQLFKSENTNFKIVSHIEWQENLHSGHYGSIFKKFSTIDSIPLGRTILHHHLYTETADLPNPVYWIIDDDIIFSATSSENFKDHAIDFFEIVNSHFRKADAIIGAMSCDPPLPTLSCIRSQLIDFLHSYQANSSFNSDYLDLKLKPDYYYDLSDMHSDHMEMPIYHTSTTENDLLHIFSGKALSRKVIQRELKAEEKTISRRGANTIVLNREVLHYYPVINIEVNKKFARRGDLTWAILNQVVSNNRFLEHTFAVDQNRPLSEFDLKKEIEKSAYDIIGYAFNKASLKVINQIKNETNSIRPKEIIEKFNQANYYQQFLLTYKYFLERRKTRFLMNYYRIIGVTSLLAANFIEAKLFHNKVAGINSLKLFNDLIDEAQKNTTLTQFCDDFLTTIWNYSNSITEFSEDEDEHRKAIEQHFGIRKPLSLLGRGNEGVVFTDDNLVYKSFFDIPIGAWLFLKSIRNTFINCSFLEPIELFETSKNKFIIYPYHQFKKLEKINASEMISFLIFCKKNKFVITNIDAKNSIQTLSGHMKFIDYGKSFEPYTEEKFINACKKAYLLYRFPDMENNSFRKICRKINAGEIPNEIFGWEDFYMQTKNDMVTKEYL